MEAAEGVMDLGSACPDWYFPNASGRGYYRWKIPPEDTAHLHDAVLQLDPIEQLAYADAVGAGFRRGDVSATQVLEAAERLSASPSRLVSTSLFGSIEWIRNHLLDSASRPLLATWAGKTFHARLEKVGYAKKSGETEEDALLRSELGHFLAITVREPVVRQALLERGDAVLRSAGGGHWDLSPIDPDMPGDTLGVLVQERGAPAIDALMAALPQQTDAAVRLSMAAAIGSTRDPRLQEKVRSFGLSDAVKLEEGDALLASNHASPENLASYTPWFEAHFAQIRERSTESAQGMLPEQVADGLCSIPEAESLMRFLKPRLSQLNGGVQGARRADEAIRLCTALRTRQGGDAVKRWLVRGGIPTNGL
jgi:alanyl aminopeptidase